MQSKANKSDIVRIDNGMARIESSNCEHAERLLIVEKLLKFTNLEKERLTWAAFDNRMRTVIDEQFFPTQQRVLQLQDKMGEMAKHYTQQQL